MSFGRLFQNINNKYNIIILFVHLDFLSTEVVQTFIKNRQNDVPLIFSLQTPS